jgi:hypothetical protein
MVEPAGHGQSGRPFPSAKINPADIKVNLERQDNLEVLEVKIELPDAR